MLSDLKRVKQLEIPEVKLLSPRRYLDDRGFFSEVWNKKTLASDGIDLDFVQDNHSFSAEAGTLRGLHFQTPPHAQDKLVRCTRGRVFDVAVDIRRSSATFGKYVGVELSADNWLQLLVPKGFAHGFVTLEPNTEIQYKVTDYYAPECDACILWSDPAIGIEWPVDKRSVKLSVKDGNAPLLNEIEDLFE